VRALTILLVLLAPAAPAPAGAADDPARRGPEWLGPSAPAAPRRVISLAPSLTDTVVALGLADRLVGVTRYDDAPEVARLPRVGGFLDPNPEAVLGLRPDLVLWLTDGGALGPVRKIAELGVPVRALPVVSVADALAAARLVGAALGEPLAGERLAERLDRALAAARRRGEGRRPVRVLVVVGREPLVVAGPGSYPDELLRLAGGRNAVEGGRPWPVFPLERAVALDPDLVVDGALNEPREALSRLAAIPAVRRGAVHRLRSDAALRPGPRLVEAVAELEAALDAAPPRGPGR
jgi:iron complex transport system substrate-binding protein